VHVLTTLGTQEMERAETRESGLEKLQRSIQLAKDSQLGE